MTSTRDIQRRLIARGYNVGATGADGVFGRNTIEAIKKFQADQKLDIRYPGTIGPKTLAALGFGDDAEETLLPPWVAEALRKKGLHERLNNAELRAYLKSDGQTLGDPALLPWCGDLMETVIALTLPREPMIENPYWARNWLKFGVSISIDKPVMGAIGVVERPGGGGHVFIIVGHDKTHWHALGGNQKDGISIVKIAKDRTLGVRFPSTYALPSKVLKTSTFTGAVSTNEA